jgi:CubicO group peptidase (beta-lactamase class C family)
VRLPAYLTPGAQMRPRIATAFELAGSTGAVAYPHQRARRRSLREYIESLASLLFRCALCLSLLLVCGDCANRPSASRPASDHPSHPPLGDAEGADPLLPPGNPELTSAQLAALQELVDNAEASDSDSLIVIHKGQTIVDRHGPRSHGELLPLSSITKMFVAMAVGLLVSDGLLNVDTPVSHIFTEWDTTSKSGITLGHLLRHTSGLARVQPLSRLDRADDPLALARTVPLDSPIGTRFSYNNVGAELVSGIIQHASGLPTDVLVRDRVLAPLGITRFAWLHDRSGAPYGYGGLLMRSHDVARVGAMLLQDGGWLGRAVLPPGWINAMTHPSAQQSESMRYGLFTQLYEDPRDPSRTIAFGHNGDGYQYLVVSPTSSLAIVRLRDSHGTDPVPFEPQRIVSVVIAFDGQVARGPRSP